MNGKMTKTISLILMFALLVTSLLTGCSEDNKSGDGTTIYIPLVLPLSGQAAAGYAAGVAPFEAYCEYINTEDPIPGVELEMLYYDTQYNPAESIPGYEWTREQGAKFICWTDSVTAETVMDLANEDKFPVFLGSGTKAITEDQGYVFSTATEFNDQTAGFMKWLENNWPNYPTKPKVGAFGWNITFGTAHAGGAEDYAIAHPDKFEWVGKELAPFGTTSWTTEVNNLKDCDYIIAGAFAGGAAAFINELRAAGSDAKTVHSDANMSFWNIYYDSCGAAKLDGALWIAVSGYINTDDTPMVTTVKHIIDTYCSTEDQGVVYGTPYVAISNYISFYFCVEMLREAVKLVDDPADITGEQLYDIATTLVLDEEGYPTMAYSETQRALTTSFKMYEFSGTTSEFIEISDWVTMPAFE